jgi:hypothetical protein
MKAADAAFRHPPGDAARSDPGCRQVRRRHDTVLASRDGKHRPVRVHDSPRDTRSIGVW